jgi:hypothetical protein
MPGRRPYRWSHRGARRPSSTVPTQNRNPYQLKRRGAMYRPATMTMSTMSPSSAIMALRSKVSNRSNVSPDAIFCHAMTSAMAAAPFEAAEAMNREPTSGSVAAQSGRAVMFRRTPV